MPCYSYEPSEEEAMRNDAHNKNKQELDTVTRLLCSTLRQIENNKSQNLNDITATDLPSEFLKIEGLSDWWTEHKKWDELRLIREENKRKELERQELIKKALKKLSDKEKEALGL